MGVNLQHLRSFHAIALEGSISRAARRLNVAQPTLSQQLKALEERHSLSLFTSRKPPLRLSVAGEDLFRLTTRLFATASDIDLMLGEAVGLDSGTLRLGSDSPPYAARLVEKFHKTHPGVSISVRMGNAKDVMRWLAEAEIDAAVASDPSVDGAFTYDPLFQDVLTLALPAGHPKAEQILIPMTLLQYETVILREPGSKTRLFTEQAISLAGLEFGKTLEVQSRESIRECVAQGVGVSAFFGSECPPDPRIIYRPLDLPRRAPILNGYLVCLTERRKNPLLRSLRQIAEAIHKDR